MKSLLVGLLVCSAAWGAEEGILFEDDLKGELGEGWSWLRAEGSDWRITEDGLEIRIRPGDANTVRNALLREAPPADRLAIEVTVRFLEDPIQQWEQAGITWYQGEKPVFKLVHERIDGRLMIVPGKPLAETLSVRLRLETGGGRFVAKYRPEGEENYITAAEGELPRSPEDKISLQAYHGPENIAHWVRFSEFVIRELPE
jgi:hypothetical protein